eukprot:scaffold616_cov306-Pavlova_lutheri.AAC.38
MGCDAPAMNGRVLPGETQTHRRGTQRTDEKEKEKGWVGGNTIHPRGSSRGSKKQTKERPQPSSRSGPTPIK